MSLISGSEVIGYIKKAGKDAVYYENVPIVEDSDVLPYKIGANAVQLAQLLATIADEHGVDKLMLHTSLSEKLLRRTDIIQETVSQALLEIADRFMSLRVWVNSDPKKIEPALHAALMFDLQMTRNDVENPADKPRAALYVSFAHQILQTVIHMGFKKSE